MRLDALPRMAALLSLAVFLCCTSATAQTTSIPFLVNNGGADSETTTGDAVGLSIGYSRFDPGTGVTPSGVAIFGLRQNDIVVSETGVPASATILSGRIPAEVDGPLRTGLAIANPDSQDAIISFYFSDDDRMSFGEDTTIIPAGEQIAAFLDEDPFNGGTSIDGTFTFTSTVPVAAVALRGLTNGRSDFLMTTLPVSPLAAEVGETAYFPHFADGGGWMTEVILVNPTDSVLTGTIQFYDKGTVEAGADPVDVNIDGSTDSTFDYTVRPRSSVRLPTSGDGATPIAGSVRVVPDQGEQTPSGLAVFSFTRAGITVSEAGVSVAATGQAFRLYVEETDATQGAIQTGIAVVNPSNTPVLVSFELLTLGGGSTGLTGSETIPADGQLSLFLQQIEGLESLETPFVGVLRISTDAVTGIAIVGLRSRVNGRDDFLITTTTLANEAGDEVSEERFFPHLVDGAGYTTRFVLLSGSDDQTMVGTMDFIDRDGAALDLPLETDAASDVSWQNNVDGWEPSSTPPECSAPLVLPMPVSLADATSVLYPGQLRGNNYKAHGGLRFDRQGQSDNIQIVAPIDAELFRAARYLEGGNVQYMFDFINPCGIMYRLDHLRELSSRLEEIADTLPGPNEGDSRTTNLAPGQIVRAGEVLATAVGTSDNKFFDWGVYDLRTMNDASGDADWLADHGGEQAPYGICWLEYLSAADSLIVNALPPSDSVSGDTSDYCD